MKIKRNFRRKVVGEIFSTKLDIGGQSQNDNSEIQLIIIERDKYH